MAQDYAKRFYNSTAWKKARALYLTSQLNICEDCGGIACIVHHIKHITPANINNPEITLNQNNLKAVCVDCHSAIHAGRTKLSGIAFDEIGNVIKQANVFLICGSPASGKSYYVKAHKTNHDLVVDLDYICAAFMGTLDNIYLDHEPILSVVLEVRALLYSIIKARRGKWRKAFVISGVADVTEQRAIANELGAELILIDTPLEECLKRLRNDERRAKRAGLFEELIHKWHREYEESKIRAAIWARKSV